MNIRKTQANSSNELAYECSKNERRDLTCIDAYNRGVTQLLPALSQNAGRITMKSLHKIPFYKKCSVGQLY